MGKSPRKGISDKIFKKTSPTRRPETVNKPQNYAGKNLKSYNHHNFKRKYSIADSSSSSDSDKTRYKNNTIYAIDSGSDSESSLTAVSENETQELTKKDFEKMYTKGRKTVGKKVKQYAKKRTPKKTVDWSAYQDAIEDSSENDFDEEEEQQEEDEEEEDDEAHNLEGLYSLMNKRRKSRHQQESEQEEEESGNSSSEVYSSSDDDSEVDFVKLQHERKAKSMKAVRALKGLPKYNENAVSDDSEDDFIEQKKPNRRKSSIKYGKRRANSVLPEDINFKFEFEDAANSEEEQANQQQSAEEEEEDIGEEVDFSPTIPEQANIESTPFEFDFDNQLIQVPRINEEEINSDEDYEIDDNELLAALQVDNDIDDELITPPERPTPRELSRQGSIVSSNADDDEDDDPFLKEEEKFLVNEFENNGFDEDELNIDGFDSDNSSIRLITSFKGIESEGDRIRPIIQYETSEDSEDDQDDYEDFVDFDVPLFEKSDEEDSKPIVSVNKKNIKNKKKKSGTNSDEDDDSYLWNYFFSSDNNSSGEEEEQQKEKEQEVDPVEDLFKEIDQKSVATPKKKQSISVPTVFNDSLDMEDDLDYDLDYDSGESTDVDLSLPTSSSSTSVGSKVAKEVLSSKTADYRPPVLGSWVTIDSKPFGIIDGLSTRSLSINNKSNEPRTTAATTTVTVSSNAKRIILPPIPPTAVTSDDSALGLDELLNVSELDNDDENDVRIWRDFNNQKKSVPLGAFRNKSILQNSIIHPEKVTSQYNHTTKSNNDFNKRRYSLSNNQHNHHHHVTKKQGGSQHKPSSSKSKRRRQSIMEAVAEGYRPTKSGLFNENAMIDVEEVLGDDHDLLMLIKGL
ncbi:Transcriptional regulator IFH1 [Spathaspora sp. JA1]|nr:Transcriptional regulator IFH1 [Spathaspora sp. JA1]